MAQNHEYPMTVNWEGGRGGSGGARCGNSGTEFPLSVGPEYGGPGKGTNPEELLTAALAACYSITFGIIAENRKIPVRSLRVSAAGLVEQSGMQFTYKQIVLKPEIVLEEGATVEQIQLADDMAHKAELYCIITNAVRDKVEVVLEPSITVG